MDLGTSITRILFLKQIGFWMKATGLLRSRLALQPTDVYWLGQGAFWRRPCRSTSRETRRDRADHHVSRVRQGVVHHRCLVPRGRRQDSPVISSTVAFLGSDTRLSFERVTPYRDIRRSTMNQTIESKNKALVLEAFDTLFNKRDYAAAERYWSPNYIQHSAHIEPGRDGLFKLIKSIPPTLKYEPGTIVAEKDFVIVHGRFSGFGQPVNWIAADIV